MTEAENPDEISSIPVVLPPEDPSDWPTHHVVRRGTVTPNRIFVGRLDHHVNEFDLRYIFSQHGAIRDVKIVTDRFGMSKGYGFVTFETQDAARKILCDAHGVTFNNRRLIIGQAIHKRQASGQNQSALVIIPDSFTSLPLYLTTSAGRPYTYHNGVAYFSYPNMSPPAHHWPPAPPAMLPPSHQPVYQQATYNHLQYQWNVVQSPMPSSPVVYPQPSEYLFRSANGDPVQPHVPVMEDTSPEFVEPVLPLYPPRTEGPQHHGSGKVKPKYGRCVHRKDHCHLPEAAEPADATALHAPQPLV